MKEKDIKEFGSQKVPYVESDPWSGITKREYFAGLAMIGMTRRFNESLLDDDDVADRIAKRSVLMADALIRIS